MRKLFKIFPLFMVIIAMTFLSRYALKQKSFYIMNILIWNGLHQRKHYDPEISRLIESVPTATFSEKTILKQGNGIIFVETTDRMEPPPMVLCAIESAARVYPDRPVVFFMKGLGDIMTEEDEKRTRERFPTLSSFHNIYFFPLKLNKLFNNTPLMEWFEEVNPKKERYWTHVSSDACRFAMMWKYGGIYMDSDIISIRPIPHENFLAAEHSESTSSSVYGLSPFHNLTWLFMEDFAHNYRGDLWGHQGPKLFTRIVVKLCGMPEFTTIDDLMCANIPYLHPRRFYPLSYESWKKYFEVWENFPTFDNSYALHLWNYMNNEGKTMVPGSNTLADRLYQKQCPTTYNYILKNNL